MATVPTVPTAYTLEEAEADIATLRGLVDQLTEAIAMADGPIPNVTAASGCTLYSGGGHAKYEGFDSGEYNTGRSSVVITANQTISSASDTIIGANSVPMSWPVGIGTYLITGMCNWAQGAAGVTQNFGLNGPAISSQRICNNWMVATLFATNGPNTREITTASFSDAASPAYNPGVVVEWHFTGVFTTTAAGTVSVVAAAPIPADTFTIGASSFASLWPVT